MYANMLRRKFVGTAGAAGDDIWTKIGPTVLAAGDMEAGFFGEVPDTDFITAADLKDLVGLNQGTPLTDRTWLKFAYEGNIQFISKTIIVPGVTLVGLEDLGIIKGKNFEIGGYTFKVRLVQGVREGVRIPPVTASTCYGSEWNRLLIPLSKFAVDKGSYYIWGDFEVTDPERIHAEAVVPTRDFPNGPWRTEWNPEGYSDVDFSATSDRSTAGFQNYKISIVQERLNSAPVVRGHSCLETSGWTKNYRGIEYFATLSDLARQLGWRPCLELVV